MVFASAVALATACTYVEVPYAAAENRTGAHLIGRTMELGAVGGMAYTVDLVPAVGPASTYAYVGAVGTIELGGLKIKVVTDGLNEVGLSVSVLVLDESEYEEAQAGVEALLSDDVPPVLLAGCGDVACALRKLASSRVVLGPVFEASGMKGHWALADASGRSVVVEYLRGQRMVHENFARVLTNDPPLEWHLRNLNGFSALTPGWPSQNDFLRVDTQSPAGVVPRPVGHGWNLLGLPGDLSPPARFVRMFFLRGYALQHSPPAGFGEAVALGTALLNHVFIPLGAVALNPELGQADALEYTPYGLLKSPVDKKFLFRGYGNTQWRMVDLAAADLSKPMSWPVEDGSQGVLDVTPRRPSAAVAETRDLV